jgi:hypothetical protein
MSKYISIKESLVVDSGTAEIVVGTTASAPISTGTNSSDGQVNLISTGAQGTGYTTQTGVATTGGGNNDCTVDIIAAAGLVTGITVNNRGTGYAASTTLTISGGGGNATFTVDSVGNLGSNGNIVKATGIGIGVVSGDIVYNVSANTQGVVNLRIGDNEITCTTALFPLGGETAAVRKLNQLNAVSTFTTRKVRVGDIVKNTSANTETTVAALINETSLTLTSDIFNSPTLFNDNFTIETPANEVYDNGQNFVTTVSVGDEVFDTTDDTSGIVGAVLDNFRLRLGTNLLAIGDNFTVYSQSGGLPRFIPVDGIMFVNPATALTTDIFMSGNTKITLTHDTVPVLQSGIVKSIQNAQLRAITAAGGAEPVVLPPRIYVTDIAAVVV